VKFQIFDVSHGFCGLISCDNGNYILVDCGHDFQKFSPSIYLSSIGCREIEALLISNYDEDHVSGIEDVRKSIFIKSLYRNKSVTPTTLNAIKSEIHHVSPAMKSVIEMSSEYCLPQTQPPEFGQVKMHVFHNNYPDFTDTNNLSLAVFFEYCDNGTVILYPGDIEKSGWDKLLEDSNFLFYLKKVKIFIASHHGRVNGYNEKVFNYCCPDIIIISDKSIIHDTQQNSYAKHAKGIQFNGTETRKVITTRNDGKVEIDIQPNGACFIQTTKR